MKPQHHGEKKEYEGELCHSIHCSGVVAEEGLFALVLLLVLRDHFLDDGDDPVDDDRCEDR